MSACNSYVDEARAAGGAANRQLLADAARYVTRMLKVFGAVPSSGPEIGFPLEGDTTTDVSGTGGSEFPQQAMRRSLFCFVSLSALLSLISCNHSHVINTDEDTTRFRPWLYVLIP